MLDPILMLARYVGGLRGFLQHPLPAEECRRIVETQLRNREQAFLAILERGVFGNPRSPYRKLLEHAGLGLAEVSRMLARLGVEGALEELLERGVHVGLEELKGRRPILRRGLELRVRPGDFDNPLLAPHYETRTGGSRGPRTRLVVDLDLLAYEAAQTQLFVSAFGAEDRPVGIWREVLPGPVGIKTFLRHAKIGGTVSKWFTPRKPLTRAEDLKFHAFTMATALLSRWAGRPMPWPEHVPPAEAGRVAAWLAEQRRIGTPALLDANPSGGARVCIAAREQGLDISGTLFRFSAEPYTPAKAALVRERGCRAASHCAAG